MYPPHHYGGYELACREVVDQLRERGHEVLVLTSQWRVDGVGEVAGEREAGVWRDLELYWNDHVVLRPSLARRLAIERANQRRLQLALDAATPDVVSIWHMGAMSLGLLTSLAERGFPLVYTVADDWLIYGPQMDAWARLFLKRPRLARPVRRLTQVPTTLVELGSSGTFCFVSTCTMKRAEELGGWHFIDAAVVPLGINTRDFPVPAELPPGRGWRWRLLYVGRIDDRKGIDTVIRAMRHLPAGATLELVGRGDSRHRAHLEELAAELDLTTRVRFRVADRDELRTIYAAADVVVFPSTWEEPFGLVPLEAMACGTPVVATGSGGSGEFLTHDDNCLLFSPGDERALADALIRLEEDPALRQRLVRSGIRSAALLTTDRLSDDLESRLLSAARFATKASPIEGSPR
jgi:glycosyltransferase involved in cell wall biosynthesis